MSLGNKMSDEEEVFGSCPGDKGHRQHCPQRDGDNQRRNHKTRIPLTGSPQSRATEKLDVVAVVKKNPVEGEECANDRGNNNNHHRGYCYDNSGFVPDQGLEMTSKVDRDADDDASGENFQHRRKSHHVLSLRVPRLFHSPRWLLAALSLAAIVQV